MKTMERTRDDICYELTLFSNEVRGRFWGREREEQGDRLLDALIEVLKETGEWCFVEEVGG